MDKVRIIICSTEDGSKEDVIFTQEFDTPASDYCRPGLTIDCDEVKELDLPSAFPLEHTLTKT